MHLPMMGAARLLRTRGAVVTVVTTGKSVCSGVACANKLFSQSLRTEKKMMLKTISRWVLIGGLVTAMAACAPLTRGQRNAAIGSAAGGALGYVLTGGPIGTIGGAAIGGAIGATR